MARTVNIAFNVDTSRAVAGVAVLNNQLKMVRTNINAINNMKINPNISGLNSSLATLSNTTNTTNNNFNTLVMNMQKINIIMNNSTNIINSFNGGLGGSANNLLAMQTAMSALSTITSYFGFVLRNAKKDFDEFLKLENALYNLGVVASKSNIEIKAMRYEMLEMAKGKPFSALEITKSLDDVVRTGQSFKGAMDIVNSSMQLASASGEELSDSVYLINKIMVALKTNTKDADKVTQSLHATAIATASDMTSLGNSAKQYAGALGGLSALTKRSGSDLDEYRVNLVKLGSTFSGILANLGRAGEQQGEHLLCPYVARVA